MISAYEVATRHLPPTIKPTGDVRGYPWPILGTAVDTRLRMWFGENDHPGTAQGVRILRLSQNFTHSLDAAEAGAHLLERMRHFADRPYSLTEGEEDTAARYAILAARYEAIYRSTDPTHGRRAMAHFTDRPPYTGPEHPLTILAREIHPAWVADVRCQLDAAVKPLASMRANGVICGPIFAGSPDVGHAEGDFIAAGMLIDCKSTINPRQRPHQTRAWFRQLCAYLLLDYEDAYEITHVGVYLARQATLLTWSTRGFLNRMGARMCLTDLRHNLKFTLSRKELAA